MEDRLIDIEIISNQVDLLLDLSDNIISKKIEYNTDDSFAFMSLCFLTKQIEHCRSIRFLVNAEQFSDTKIIARVTIEGLIILVWCYKNPNYYGSLWKNYAVISDYKLYKQTPKAKISPKMEQEILTNLKSMGGAFLKKKARSIKNEHISTQEFPYAYQWLVDENGNEIKISKLFTDIDKQLQKIYRDMSGWIHWDIGSIGQNLVREKNVVKIAANNTNDGALSLAVGYQSLLGVMEIVNRYLALGFDKKLTALRDDFKSTLEKLQSNSN